MIPGTLWIEPLVEHLSIQSTPEEPSLCKCVMPVLPPCPLVARDKGDYLSSFSLFTLKGYTVDH